MSDAMDYYSGETPMARTIRMVMEEAAAKERERCAKIAAGTTGDECWPKGETIGEYIARKIRDHQT